MLDGLVNQAGFVLVFVAVVVVRVAVMVMVLILMGRILWMLSWVRALLGVLLIRIAHVLLMRGKRITLVEVSSRSCLVIIGF